jgi:hypothetical protein
MGCWGYGIMESDGALDIASEFHQMVGVYFEDGGETGEYSLTMRTLIEGSMEELLTRARSEPVCEDYTVFRAEAFQVLAALVMRAGCALTEEQRGELLAGLQDCSEYRLAKKIQAEAQAADRRIQAQDLIRHEWEESAFGFAGDIDRMYGRIRAIEGEAALLRDYTIGGGQPVEVPTRGLFDAFAEKQAEAARIKQSEKKVVGYAVENCHGLYVDMIPAVRNFYGAIVEEEPDADLVANRDREFAGEAPHRLIKLYTE